MSDLLFEEFSALYLAQAVRELPGFGDNTPRFTDPAVVRRLYTVADRLIDNARRFNLTAILEPSEIVRKHLIDSLMPLGLLLDAGIRPKSVLDVGSGAGFPLLPMASAMEGEGTAFTALDSTAKKISHILETASAASLPSVSAVVGRAEEVSRGELREKFDLVVARAVANLPVLAELCVPFVSVGGYFAALKGDAAEELPGGDHTAFTCGATRVLCIPYEIPGGDKRTLVVYRKTTPTSAKFPRRYSEIVKHPLK